MKLSIITINFNNADGLKQTIYSVVNQKNCEFEYIVVDGGSTDGSKQMIEDNSSKITKWVSEKDNGIYHAMNKGWKMASGEYCLFLNSGDYLKDENVIQMVLENGFNSDIISYGEICEYSNYFIHKLPPRKITLYTFYKGSLSHPSTFISRRLLLELGGYREEYKIMSDWCFFLEALIMHNCSYSWNDEIISVFDTTGVSSKGEEVEGSQAKDFLQKQFPRIISDYEIIRYEPIYNVLSWLNMHPRIQAFIYFANRVLNRCLNLRTKLGVRQPLLYSRKS